MPILYFSLQDGRVFNVNYADPNLADVVIPEDFLTKIYLARCSYNYSNSCSSPQGQISDFNIWDEFKSDQFLLEWTTCT